MKEAASCLCAWRNGWRGALAAGAACAVVTGAMPASASESEIARPYAITETREPCARYEVTKRPFFGDTHVHTAYSFDASSQDTRNTPRDAYRFAKGAALGLQPYDAEGKARRRAALRRPLDFTVVTDHAEMFGEVRICRDPDLEGYDSDFCWLYRGFGPTIFNAMALRTIVGRERFRYCGEGDRRCLEAAAVVWSDIRAAAEEAYDRSAACTFTSFVGYEWTGSVGVGANLHRNVVFRNEKVPAYAPSFVEAGSAAMLWQVLEDQCVEGTPGCDALTIPHNSNLSGPGLMFETAALTGPADAGRPMTREEARRRQRWEPLIEIMQHKGDSECLLGGDTTDEACGFEKLPYNSFAGVGRFRGLFPDYDPAPVRGAMVREALKNGLRRQGELGANPFKYGIVASTDSHLGTPGLTLEDAPAGHGGAGLQAGLAAGLPDDPEFNPGGLAVLWAEENARDALFGAMRRREAYGTSGTRPVVRFFGGWEYRADLCGDEGFAEKGYAGGVPMGGDLPPAPGDGQSPRFAVWALQDPGTEGAPGTPLQRVQIVKGWVEDGASHERVFDVAGGENDATVDPATCERRGAGAAQLCAVWTDPDFEPGQPAFYYARVLENPTCRWSQRVCVAAAVDCADPQRVPDGFAACCAEDRVALIQERAWTSPIWYTP